MSSRDKKAEEIIEETMQGIFNDLNRSKSMNEMDDSDDIPRKKSSGKKTSQKGGSHKRTSDHKKTSGKRTPDRDEGVSGRSGSGKGGSKRTAPDRDEGSSGSGGSGKGGSGRTAPDRGEGVSGRSGSGKGGSERIASGREGQPRRGNSAKAVSQREPSKEDIPHKKKPRKKNPDSSGVSSDRDVSGTKSGRQPQDALNEVDDREEAKMGKRGRRRKRDKEKSKKALKIALITAGSAAGVLLTAYIGLAVYFNSHFMFFTTINGTDCSMKSVGQVEDEMKKKVADYKLTLKESGGAEETIAGSDISIKYVPGNKLEEIVKEQNGFSWPKSLWDHPEIETEIGVKYDEAALGEMIAALDCMNPEGKTPSVDAHPEFKDGQFVVAPEVVGTQINGEVLSAKIAEAISGFQPSLDLSEKGCYALPRFVSDSPEVKAAADAMNGYLGANVTYDFNPEKEVVDASVISQWVKVDGDMNVTFDEEAVRGYVQSLAEKYNTKGVPRQFTTATGNVVTVEGGGFGWRIDQDAEYTALLANIQNGETVTREPNYLSRGISHGGTDVGGTYAEVDLTNQRMYFIKDGQIVLQSDCVTGNPNKGYATPQGVYSLAWKQKNRTLRGEKQPDGTYEYETPVAFWMPFNGGIGFHDATWQSAFGGRRYQTHGSHGCVNLPYSIAQQLYDLMYDGVPVVCHY